MLRIPAALTACCIAFVVCAIKCIIVCVRSLRRFEEMYFEDWVEIVLYFFATVFFGVVFFMFL